MARNFNNLATELSASASRLTANIHSLFEKYDQPFPNDDLISLSSMSVCRLSSRGALRAIKGTHDFGDSKLKTTKKKAELLRAKLGLQKNKVDLNVSRAIQRECAVALADLNEANADEPSDAETLSSFDEDEFDEEDDEKSANEEDEDQNFRDSFDNSESDNSSRLTDIGSRRGDSSTDRSRSDSSPSLNSSGANEISSGEEANKKDVHKFNTTVTLISGDAVGGAMSSNDVEGGGAMSSNDVEGGGAMSSNDVEGGKTKVSELTFVFDCHDDDTHSEQARPGNKGHDDLSPTDRSQENVEKSMAHAATEKSLSVKSFVSISSPRPKIRGRSQHFKISMPNSLKSNQSFVADKSKCAKAPVMNKLDDDLFKSPQGIRVKRVVPVFVGPASFTANPSNHALVSPKHSSHSSGFSSGSSSWKTRDTRFNNDGNNFNLKTNSRSEKVQLSQTVQDTPVYDDVRIIEGQQNHYQPSNREPPPHCSNEWQFTHSKCDGNRVEQWVDLVNSNTAVSNQPLHYPSCPPKVPGQFSSIPQVSQTPASSVQHSMMSSSSRSYNKRDIGIQTNLNSTAESNRRDVLLKKMKDVSIVLSNSFLEAHSPKPKPSCSCENIKDTPKETSVLKPVNNMFHEDYIYQFSPLNPNRQDSDETTNLHQTHRMKQGLRHFRPWRNEKRPFMSEFRNNSSSSDRPSKCRRINDRPDPKSPDYRSGDNSFVLPNILSWDDLNHTYILHSSTGPLQAHKDSSGRDSNFVSTTFTQKRMKSQISRQKSVSQADYNNRRQVSKANNSFRASSPLHVNDCNVLNDPYGVINSSLSEAERVCSCLHDEDMGQSLIPPKLGVFLNSNGYQSRNNSTRNQTETTGSGSFLDAHTPKPKLTTLSRQGYHENMTHGHVDSINSIEEGSTEEYSLNLTVRDSYDSPTVPSFLNVSSNREHHSGVKLLDNTLSSIHGLDSDDEDEMKFDEGITGLRRQVLSKFNKNYESKKLERKEIYSNDYEHNSSSFSNKKDAKCSAKYKKYIQAFQPRRNKRRQCKTSGEQKSFSHSKQPVGHKGQPSYSHNNPLSSDNFSVHHTSRSSVTPQENIFRTDIFETDRRPVFRASTPVPQLNHSLSTVYNPQDDSDVSGEDWNSMLIQDVDVLS